MYVTSILLQLYRICRWTEYSAFFERKANKLGYVSRRSASLCECDGKHLFSAASVATVDVSSCCSSAPGQRVENSLSEESSSFGGKHCCLDCFPGFDDGGVLVDVPIPFPGNGLFISRNSPVEVAQIRLPRTYSDHSEIPSGIPLVTRGKLCYTTFLAH